ncbi:hypothetical protein [Salinispira pacifica]|uniref:Lipoprotein n=1 Tax=Salinispira pacifica TaxID=1307761 RepID=V5WKN8_9SPIO|nr:hypothetical protein [Salinispira pacifica]AHC16210.1 hypothetical protein L21SP2_2862 [Salinispira pacifica]
MKYSFSTPRCFKKVIKALSLSALLIGFSLITACYDFTSENEPPLSENQLRLGMSENAFQQLYPDARETGEDRYVRNTREFGVQGNWIYSFHDGTLNWYIFNSQETEISEERFQKKYRAVNQMIADLTMEYGNPWREDRGYSDYINPDVQAHQGYKVREAQWKTEDGKVTVDFTFLGDGGVYSLLLTLQATGSNS